MTATIIHVTQEDIEEGERRSCVGCPLARALRRATKKGDGLQWRILCGKCGILSLPCRRAFHNQF